MERYLYALAITQVFYTLMPTDTEVYTDTTINKGCAHNSIVIGDFVITVYSNFINNKVEMTVYDVETSHTSYKEVFEMSDDVNATILKAANFLKQQALTII